MDTPDTVWATGFLPNGRKVSITALNGGDVQSLVSTVLALDIAMSAAGITPREQGVEAGEQVETIHYVLRTSILNRDNTDTPRIYLYTERFNFKFLNIYLNTQDDIAAFENAVGYDLTAIPYFEGDSALERGKNPQKDNKYLAKLGKPVQIVWKQNPAWEGDDDKQHPKRVFVRWLTAAPAPTATPPLAIAQKLPPATLQAAETFGSGSQGRRIPTGAENAANSENGRSGAKWAYDFQSLMKHLDVARQIPQSNHRAATITLLNNSNVFDDAQDLNIAAYRVNAYSAFRAQGMEQEQAIAAVMETETF